MALRVTGIGAFGLSLNWEKVDGDKQIARNVITFLEDRRVLFVHGHSENAVFAVHSAIVAREFLTEQLAQAQPGKSLEASLRAMRASFRRFVQAGGDDGHNFEHHRYFSDLDPLSLALGALRSEVGLQVLLIAYYYGLEVEEELAAILPVIADDESGELEADTR
jgi:hypothetical protein